MDRGFWYRIPEHLADETTVGRLVRVPLSGRRVRGWIVEIADESEESLKEIAAVSGDTPVFGPELLQTLEWAAIHYVAPLSVLLGKATPPNLPRRIEASTALRPASRHEAHAIDEMAASAIAGSRRPSQALVGNWQRLDWPGALRPVISSGRSVLVVAATAAEVEAISRVSEPLIGASPVAVAGEDDAVITAAWEQAQFPGRLVVGTPRTSTWQIAGLSLVVVLEEGRRAMKERQTPTLHVREVVRRRSLVESFGSVFFGPTPSVEVLAAGAEVSPVGNRAWPLVEIVDRSQEPPGSGLVGDSVVAALRAVAARGERCFVFTFRSLVDQCVHEINARLGAPRAGRHPSERPITVGTERDLAGMGGFGLTVAANVDGLLLVPGYRASEEALRQLARLGNALAPGPRHRMMAQVMDPSLPIVDTLKRGDPIPYLERVLVERGRANAPPSTEIIAVELRDHVPADVQGALQALPDGEVLGPLRVDNGMRWLIEGRLAEARLELRDLVGRWREAGATVRVDADPIDV